MFFSPRAIFAVLARRIFLFVMSSRSALRNFLAGEAAGGILLILASALALLAANMSSGSSQLYHHLLHTPLGPVLTDKLGPMTPHLWINDGLMAIFFLVVGLEIKRELIDGRLSTWRQRRLPVVAAVAGMAVPAALYLWVANGNAVLNNGWAIPSATDIAFAIGVLALLGKRVPTSLKLFLTTVAIVDDMGAVAIIALVYTPGVKLAALVIAATVLAAMYVMNRAGVKSLPLYLLFFFALWYAVLLSGVHATIAGVLAAFTIPLRPTPGAPDAEDSPLHRLENKLHPWSAFLIIPLFGFANAGVSLEGMSIAQLMAPLPLGVACGLFLGKQLGIFGSIWMAVRANWAHPPRGATWMQIYGVSVLCGVGFTMSLFIGALAFPGRDELIDEAKIGILMGSLASALLGYAILRFAPLHPEHERINQALETEIDADGDIDPER